MAQIIAIGIGILVFIIGFAIYRVGLEILDEGDYFFYAVGFFLVLFAIAGVALYFLLPRPPKNASLSTLSPTKIVNGITHLAERPYLSQGESITYASE